MIAPGGVVWVEFDPVSGREQGGRRPAVVVSSPDHLAAAASLVAVVPATTRARGWPNHVPLVGPLDLDAETYAMTEQIRTIARTRIVGRAGQLDVPCFGIICQWVHRWLAAPG